MDEVERILSFLKATLSAVEDEINIEGDIIFAKKGGRTNVYAIKIYPPTPASVEIVSSFIISKKPENVFVITSFEDWKISLEESLKEKGVNANVERISLLDVGGMIVGTNLFVEHIGVATKSIENSTKRFYELFGVKPSHPHIVESEGVLVSFMWLGQTRIEFLEPIKDSSAVKTFIEKRGEGIHHIAVQVENFDEMLEKCKKYQVIGPRIGATGKRVFFLHPKDFNGILIEIVEKGYREKSLE